VVKHLDTIEGELVPYLPVKSKECAIEHIALNQIPLQFEIGKYLNEILPLLFVSLKFMMEAEHITCLTAF